MLPDIEDIKKPADVKQDTPKECPNTDIGKHLLRSYVKSLLGHFELKVNKRTTVYPFFCVSQNLQKGENM